MQLFHSLRVNLRSIIKRPVYSLIIIFTFAIATGASIVIYSYLDALLLTPLPFKNADRLVRIHSIKGGEQGLFSYPEFLDMQKQLNGIEDLAVYRDGGRYNLSGDGKPPEDLTTTFASSNLFSVLGVEAYIGSYWPETLDEKGSHTIMLTYDFWQKRFDGKEGIDNIQVTLDGFSYTNYGVLPQGFSFPARNEAFRAMAFADFIVDARTYRPCIGLARLSPGVSIEEFNMELDRFASIQQTTHPETSLGITYRAEPLKESYIGTMEGYIFILCAAALFLLAIAAINVSNLRLIQSIQNSQQTVIRKVLGSSNASIIFDSVINGIILALIGSAAGLFLAMTIIDISQGLVSPYLPHWITLKLNGSILFYAVLLAIVLGIFTGVLPWLFNSIGNHLAIRLKEGQQTTGSHRQRRMQKGLATFQIFTSVVLMIGGLLLFKSFIAASDADLGFETEKRQTFRIALSWFKYGTPEKKSDFFENSIRKIEALPEVEHVTLNSILPLTDMVNTSAESQESFAVEGQSEIEQSENPFISVQRVIPNYFDAMGIDIIEGSSFDPEDPSKHRFSTVIDRKLADKMWPDGNAIGNRINIWGEDSDRPLLEVVGIAENVKHQSVTGENIPNIYVSFYAYPHTDAHYVVKSDAPISELSETLTSTILSMDENQPTFEYMPMTDIVAMNNWQSKVSSTLFLTIALIGSVIAAVGLFSMMTFILMMKLKELALRRVLGASDGGVVKLVLKEMLGITGLGIVAGVLLSPLLLQPISPLLYEVNLFDLTIYLFVIVAFLGASLLATIVPFNSALTANPAVILKGE